jgi:hypothetical protein
VNAPNPRAVRPTLRVSWPGARGKPKLETELKIEIANPPNFEQIVAAFPNASQPGVIFAYGDTIYNPSNIVISAPLLAHEEVHGYRQRGLNYIVISAPRLAHEEVLGYRQRGLNYSVDTWWKAYIEDPEFRYREELLSHAAEYRAQLRFIHDRNERAKLVMRTAQRLLAPLYNYGQPKSLNQALSDLRWAIERK